MSTASTSTASSVAVPIAVTAPLQRPHVQNVTIQASADTLLECKRKRAKYARQFRGKPPVPKSSKRERIIQIRNFYYQARKRLENITQVGGTYFIVVYDEDGIRLKTTSMSPDAVVESEFKRVMPEMFTKTMRENRAYSLHLTAMHLTVLTCGSNDTSGSTDGNGGNLLIDARAAMWTAFGYRDPECAGSGSVSGSVPSEEFLREKGLSLEIFGQLASSIKSHICDVYHKETQISVPSEEFLRRQGLSLEIFGKLIPSVKGLYIEEYRKETQMSVTPSVPQSSGVHSAAAVEDAISALSETEHERQSHRYRYLLQSPQLPEKVQELKDLWQREVRTLLLRFDRRALCAFLDTEQFSELMPHAFKRSPDDQLERVAHWVRAHIVSKKFISERKKCGKSLLEGYLCARKNSTGDLVFDQREQHAMAHELESLSGPDLVPPPAVDDPADDLVHCWRWVQVEFLHEVELRSIVFTLMVRHWCNDALAGMLLLNRPDSQSIDKIRSTKAAKKWCRQMLTLIQAERNMNGNGVEVGDEIAPAQAPAQVPAPAPASSSNL
jgi:hypothetical protein